MINAQTGEADSKILVVDDNPANVKLLERILHIIGYTDIMTLTDSREALRVCSEYQPDLLLLDLRMPYIDGFDILGQLKKDAESVYMPVIIITAQDDMENRLKALNLGAQDFIGKPFNNVEVALRVSNSLKVRLYNKDIKTRNTQLENVVREKSQELDEMQHELIDKLLRAAEIRDQETGNHIARISKYALIIAKALRLSDEAAKDLALASLMHDIGKIGVPDEILNKPGRLEAPELELMRAHTLKGAQILSGSSSKIIRLAEQIAYTHHEKWDGTGYPNGLSGTQIPLAGRIIALVDMFDALLSDRPYKKAWKTKAAVDYIQEQSGSHFDPVVVKAFVESLPKLLRIKEQMK